MSTVGHKNRGEPFFLLYSLAALAIVLTGFAPSFYLRSAEHAPLSTSFMVHGAFLTSWYLLVVVQSGVIGLGRTPTRLRLHQRLGMASILIFVAVIWTSWIVAVDFYRWGRPEAVLSPAALFYVNLNNILGFALCFVAGFLRRKKPKAHKRYMALAGIVILNPAAFRLVMSLGLPPPVTVPIQLGFVIALMVYDIRREKRIQPATWIGFSLILVMMLGSFTFGESAVWRGLLETLFPPG